MLNHVDMLVMEIPRKKRQNASPMGFGKSSEL